MCCKRVAPYIETSRSLTTVHAARRDIGHRIAIAKLTPGTCSTAVCTKLCTWETTALLLRSTALHSRLQISPRSRENVDRSWGFYTRGRRVDAMAHGLIASPA
ncbi:hypothetical protein H310_12246 [Aphanomyces invadans]|uniref:Uncharacterized protein n=1 Tax=Aphanomyces invadans TaxID=157072 RepID=A0A024TKS3_9STRA|nr:hypothetical protein H310_12246 [Aphanomyces invadans]ETV93902.1 hypothetical protein H310_12246 [Aphanomyces invadans]|eukprot:XP_008877462.1 hypothetical protein H310_12246 [Aphanomyces invadans]